MQSGDTLKIYSGNAQIYLTFSPTKFMGFFLAKKKIVSENELQLVRQDHTYELWGYSIYKTYQRPKNKLKHCGWYWVRYCLTKVWNNYELCFVFLEFTDNELIRAYCKLVKRKHRYHKLKENGFQLLKWIMFRFSHRSWVYRQRTD